MPQTLGSYELQAEIGQGGMATVYRAYQPHTDRQVAIKVLRNAISSDDTALERFRREARLIARLENPHILPVYDFDGAHDPPYIVMRYIEGGTLEDVLAGRVPQLSEVKRLLRQIASALNYAHQQGIVHRDIKPSNIMLDREGDAFVTDFGIARLAGAPPPGTSITQDGIVIGTPDYIAPEQAMGNTEVDGRADIYSLGVIVFEMLSGRLPFVGNTPMAVMLKHLQELPPSLYALNPRLPPEIDSLMERVLAKDPALRFATANDFVAALFEVLGEDDGSSTLGRMAMAGLRPAAMTIPNRTPTPENKVVTALYADVAEYVELVEARAGAEDARQSLEALWERLTQITSAYSGLIVSKAESNALALWGVDSAGEDDPEQAVRAALALQSALHERITLEAGEPLPIKIGLHTGLTLLTPGREGVSATGSTISLAQRLAEAAEGSVVISHDTYREVQGVFDFAPGESLRVRGRKDKLETYVVTATKSRVIPLKTRGIEGIETRLIGREMEWKRLQDAYLNAVEDAETQALTILGEAGLGKTRLLVEFEKWIDLRPEVVRFFRGRATAGLTHRPYALLREVLAFRFELHENDPLDMVQAKMESGVAQLLENEESAAEIAHFLGHLAGFDFVDSPHLAGLLNDAKQASARAKLLFLRFFGLLAARAPVVIHLDDLHHADEASLDLFGALIGEQANLRLLFVGLARPTLLERRPAWGSGQPAHERLTLAALSKRDSRDLASEILQNMAEPPKALRDFLVERAEGNPLFMEELVKMLIEDRVIAKDSPEAWRVEESRLAGTRVPPTLKGLLQARFDTLLYPEKLTLQRAAVAGRNFQAAALAALDAADKPVLHLNNLAELLESLAEREFIYKRVQSSVAGSVEYAFTQTMLRDLIYESLLGSQRQTYHAAMAAWLASGERVDERWPIIAEHYAIAEDRLQAAQGFENAGDRAMRVSAFAEALKFYDQAQAQRESSEGPPPARLTLKQAEAHYRLGDYAAAQHDLHSVLDSSQIGSELAHALALMGEIGSATGDYAGASAALTAALPLARSGGDKPVLARVLYALGDVFWRMGDLPTAEKRLNDSIALAREINDTVRLLFALNRLGTVMGAQGQNDAEVRFYEEVRLLAKQTGNRDRLMTALNNLGTVAQERGDVALAQMYYRQALEIAEEVGVQDSIVLYGTNIAYADAKLRNREAALTGGRNYLRRAVQLGALPWVVMGLFTFAELAHYAGEHEQALALLGLVRGHPAFSRDNQRILEATLAEWQLETGRVEIGLAKGGDLNFDETVSRLIGQ